MYKKLPKVETIEVDRFWSNVEVGEENECWLWQGSRNENEYGMFIAVGRDGKCQRFRAHRISYLIATGKDPRPLQVIHSCDNPPCVNPAHLRRATNYENVQDMIAKGRNPQGDKHWARRMPNRVLRGEANGSSKLTAETVLKIRSRWQNRDKEPVSMYRLAKDYCLSAGYVKRLITGESWAHV